MSLVELEDRIVKLFQLGNSTTFPEEAQSAYATAEKIIADNRLDRSRFAKFIKVSLLEEKDGDVAQETKFHLMSNEGDTVKAILSHGVIVFVRPVQSGKTGEVLKIVEHTYKNSITIFVSDKNSALAGQTNNRAKTNGWTIVNFNDVPKKDRIKFTFTVQKGFGKKIVNHFMMEHNNLSLLWDIVEFNETPITLIIDEGDKNRNVSAYTDDDEKGTQLPVVTKMLLAIKNRLKERKDGSKIIFVTATPQSLLVSEKDKDRLTIYKQPYKNYIGAGLDHDPDVDVVVAIRDNPVPAGERWTNTGYDTRCNTFRPGISVGMERFVQMESKDTSVKQLTLISLESRNITQARMAKFVKEQIGDASIDIIVFNGDTKDKNNPLLSDRILQSKSQKIVIISGFMAARGVSFTDFSDPNNKYELVMQVHFTKESTPLNSAAQAMRLFGPARRTVSQPVMICNRVCAEDLKFNFREAYRVVRDLARGEKSVERGEYNRNRPLTQAYNFRYMIQNTYGTTLLTESLNPEDHLPINTWGEDSDLDADGEELEIPEVIQERLDALERDICEKKIELDEFVANFKMPTIPIPARKVFKKLEKEQSFYGNLSLQAIIEFSGNADPNSISIQPYGSYTKVSIYTEIMEDDNAYQMRCSDEEFKVKQDFDRRFAYTNTHLNSQINTLQDQLTDLKKQWRVS